MIAQPEHFKWMRVSNEDIGEPGREPALERQKGCRLGPRSVVVLVGR